MSPTLQLAVALATVLLYVAAGFYAPRSGHAAARWLVVPALLLHVLLLTSQLFEGSAIAIGFHEALSLFAWQSAATLWLLSLREPLRILGMAIYPLAALATAAATLVPSSVQPVPITDWKVQLHVFLSLLSAGLLTLAAVQAIALAIQDRFLHRHARIELMQALPPLQTMERLLFQLVALGFFLLSLTLISGLLFIHDLFAQHLAHKTVLSIVAWVLFAVLLWGRRYHGWRGRQAVRWSLSAYGLLFLAYFGSKWILEQVLHRQWT